MQRRARIRDMLAVNPTGGWAVRLDPIPQQHLYDDDDDLVSTTRLPAFSHASRMPAGPAGSHLTGLSGTRPILVALPDPAEAHGDVVNGAGIVKDLSLHTVGLEGLPTEGTLEVRFLQWAPKGGGFAFLGRTVESTGAPRPYQLWHADWAHTGKRSCKCQQLLTGRCINAALGPPFRWSPNGQQLLVKLVPDQVSSAVCNTTASEQLVCQHYATSTTVVVDLVAGTEIEVGPSEGRPLMYQNWVGLVPMDVTENEPGFAIMEVRHGDLDGAYGSSGKVEQFVIVTTATADVEVWRLSKPSTGAARGASVAVSRTTTIHNVVVEAALPGCRLLLRRVHQQGSKLSKGCVAINNASCTNNLPTRSHRFEHFIRVLGKADGAPGAEVELRNMFKL